VLSAEFDFELPDTLIAQHPATPREQSRLMVVERGSGKIAHHRFIDFPDFLSSKDVIARNNTRVIPARLFGRRELTGGKWQGLFLRDCGLGRWEVLATARGRLSPGEQVVLDSGLRLLLESRQVAGRWTVRPLVQEGKTGPDGTLELLERHGHTPLPPYIRGGRAEKSDRTRYQTVFAASPGSVAAPTAGLHFSEEILKDLAGRGVGCVDLTLHVGPGTFRPMSTLSIADHVMHSEWAELTAESAAELNARRARGGRIVAVGTTSARTLETAATTRSILPFAGQTSLFIKPGHVFRGLDMLLTNFHLPRSTLLVLVSALAGVELIRQAYREAITRSYRFYSYGDAMLIM
jgi:S-adenosylmethionine:tRNA ribosyltransferase-isomerase